MRQKLNKRSIYAKYRKAEYPKVMLERKRRTAKIISVFELDKLDSNVSK